MARKARVSGLLSTYRELTVRERQAVARALEDDPRAREELRLYEQEDALLRSLPTPRLDPAVTERIMAATVNHQRDASIWARRPVFAIALALLLMTLIGGTGMASSASLPGDTLYPVKRAVEQVRLAVTLREQARLRYAVHLSQVRSHEVDALLDLGRHGVAVEFVGPLQQAPDGAWSVAGIPVYMPENVGPLAPGQSVRVAGETGDDHVRIVTMAPAPAPHGPANVPARPAGDGGGPPTGDGGESPAGNGRESLPNAGNDGAPRGPAHTPGVPQGQGPENTDPRDDLPGDADTPASEITTPPPGRGGKPADEDQGDGDGVSSVATRVPPGQAKKTLTPSDETVNRGVPSDEGARPSITPTHVPPGQAKKTLTPSDEAVDRGEPRDEGGSPSGAPTHVPPGQANKPLTPNDAAVRGESDNEGDNPFITLTHVPPGQAKKTQTPSDETADRGGRSDEGTP